MTSILLRSCCRCTRLERLGFVLLKHRSLHTIGSEGEAREGDRNRALIAVSAIFSGHTIHPSSYLKTGPNGIYRGPSVSWSVRTDVELCMVWTRGDLGALSVRSDRHSPAYGGLRSTRLPNDRLIASRVRGGTVPERKP